jgi:gas vesicle protein
MGKDPDAIREEIEDTRERMSDTVEAIGYKADVPSRAKEAVASKVDAVKSSVAGPASRAREAIAGGASQASDAAPSTQDVKRTARRATGIAQENPLGLAIGAAAVGFLAGMLFPSTRVEDERVGPVADQVKDKARQVGQEAVERGADVAKEAARSAKETATQSARAQGEELAGSARQHAEDVRASGPNFQP